MYKLIISVGLLNSLFSTNDTEISNKIKLASTIDNIQDMKEWILEDINAGIIDSTYASNYINILNESEHLLINYYKQNTNK